MAFYRPGDVVNTHDESHLTNEAHIVDDLTIVPLAKDSFAICELCGRIGRRGQFYPRNNKFCSLRCHASNSRKRHCSWRYKLMEGAEHMAGLIPLEPLPQLQQWQATYDDLQAGPIKQSCSVIANSYEWKDELFGCDFLAAPVSLFKHAPLHEMWDATFEGMKVEVRNTDCENYENKLNDYFWVATVLKVKGYMGLLRYEGFGSDDSKDFWVNLSCSEVHPVGWCATRGKPLIPPRSIEDKYTDWKKFLVKQLTGARTLPANFYSKLNDSLISRFSVGNIMEVVDKNRISQVKVASVSEIIGKRLHVKYYDSSPEDNGFWCHEDSPLIHPVGWAFRIGHPLDAPQNYCHRVATGRLVPNDSMPDMFYKYPTNEPPLFAEGMKLEAIDPLNLSAVCAATVMQILNEGYMMIRIDCYPADASGADWFCYHQRSPCIFPVGFATANNIPLIPPAGFTADTFSWEQYLTLTGSQAAPRSSFATRGHVVSHGFVAGMRLECTDLMDPRLVCVATIARVVQDLLKVHFDGWGTEYDQWLWAHSTDMYPVGWCRAVRHRLEGPLQPPRAPRRPTTRAPRRRRKQDIKKDNKPGAKIQPQPPITTEDSSQNSDMGDTKSLSPLTSLYEMSADTELRPEYSTPSIEDHNNMDVDLNSKTSNELEKRLGNSRRESNENEDVTNILVCLPNDGDMSEMTPDVDSQHDDSTPSPHVEDEAKMDVDSESKMIAEPPEYGDSNLSNQDLNSAPTDTSQDSSQTIPPLSPEIPTETADDSKVIPRLVNTTVPFDVLNSVDVVNWTTADVAKFLTVNDCQPYCDNFTHITGPMMLQLSKDEIIELLQMKVGPSLKIFDLIQQLKCKIKQPQCRMLSSFK